MRAMLETQTEQERQKRREDTRDRMRHSREQQSEVQKQQSDNQDSIKFALMKTKDGKSLEDVKNIVYQEELLKD